MGYMNDRCRDKNQGCPEHLDDEDERKADVVKGNADHMKSIIEYH